MQLFRLTPPRKKISKSDRKSPCPNCVRKVYFAIFRNVRDDEGNIMPDDFYWWRENEDGQWTNKSPGQKPVFGDPEKDPIKKRSPKEIRINCGYYCVQ